MLPLGSEKLHGGALCYDGEDGAGTALEGMVLILLSVRVFFYSPHRDVKSVGMRKSAEFM